MDWRHRAACRRAAPELFDDPGEHEAFSDLMQRYVRADTFCRTCVVRDECLRDAVNHQDNGYRAGMLLVGGQPQDLSRRGQRRDRSTALGRIAAAEEAARRNRPLQDRRRNQTDQWTAESRDRLASRCDQLLATMQTLRPS